MRAESNAGGRRGPVARCTGRCRDLHGMRHGRVPGLRGSTSAWRLRPRMQRRPGLPRGRRRLVGAAFAPPLRNHGMTVDMSVEIGALRLRGRVLGASGMFGYGSEVPLLERRALGAMVSKGIFLRPRAGTPPPRIVETPGGMLNAIGLQGPGVEGLIREYAPQWAQWDFPVLVNINGETAAGYGELAARLDRVPGVAGFEINISCPNVEQGGLYFGNDPRAAAAVTEAVRRRTDLPVWVKLTPMVTDIGVIARACEAGGAHALSSINTLLWLSIDLNTRPPTLTFLPGRLSE